MTKLEQEALSRRYGDSVVLLLPLSDGSWACFNNSREEMCGIAATVEAAVAMWRPPQLRGEPNYAIDDDILTAAGL